MTHFVNLLHNLEIHLKFLLHYYLLILNKYINYHFVLKLYLYNPLLPVIQHHNHIYCYLSLNLFLTSFTALISKVISISSSFDSSSISFKILSISSSSIFKSGSFSISFNISSISLSKSI